MTLAVVRAELCSRYEGTFTDRAYLVAQDSFAQFAQLLADSESKVL